MKTFFVLVLIGAITPLSPDNAYDNVMQAEKHPIVPITVVYDNEEQCGEAIKEWEGIAIQEKVEIHYSKCIPIVLPEVE